ncbi:phosphoribosyltransferase-like protein [Lacrimispora sp.]|uniref:phosphoribosyltransferase-like protein n=1 Tax=Lacrimispora sp. TaxID=2719234 RepID=UPI0028A9A82B|nr:hypothetical protein [Lacrimispora sp.]
MDELESLEIQIAEKIKDYRKGELSFELDDKHVDRWINQFDEVARKPILQETLHLITNYYMAESDINEYISQILNLKDIFTDDPRSEMSLIQFLNVQNKGSSQQRLLTLLNQKSLELYARDINLNNSANIKQYIYVDDGLYSGSTIRHDIERWIAYANPNTDLHIVFLCMYTFGYWYSKKKIQEICATRNINVHFWRRYEFNNFTQNRYGELYYDCFWPQEVDDDNCKTYIELMNNEAQGKGYSNIRTYRNILCNSHIFSNDFNRTILEREFMRAGSYIMTVPSKSNISMRPMGYDNLTSIGFGAFFVTFMNISNNCPLALWWGDSEANIWHPFSKWYPLFPRRGNITGDDLIW